MNQQPISEELGQQMIQAVRQLAKVNQSSIVTKESEAIKKGVHDFLNRVLLEHADELIACWASVHYEYEPFIDVFEAVIRRIAVRSQIRQAQQQAQQQHTGAEVEGEEVPGNVVKLETK